MQLGQHEEEFTAFENKVDEVMKILNLMSSDDRVQSDKGVEMANQYLGVERKESVSLDNVDIDNFLVKVNYDKTIINKKESPPGDQDTQDKMSFMAVVEKDANRRFAERKQRESVAQDLRKMGNQAFRNGEFEKAVSMYTKAIDQVRDSPILYNNRALTYIRLSLYKRAIIDCDFVLSKLDEKNLRSWLYRAKAYFLLDEKRNYEKSIIEAKKHHPKELDYIDKIVDSIEHSNSDEEENGGVGDDFEGEKERKHVENDINDHHEKEHEICETVITN